MTRLANAVLFVHAAIVLFITLGLPAIWIGAFAGWGWVRSMTFRSLHLAAIGVVALLAAAGIECPLTVLEARLRTHGPATEGFVQHWVSRLLYYDLPAWAFTASYVAFALVVWWTWRRVPPVRRR